MEDIFIDVPLDPLRAPREQIENALATENRHLVCPVHSEMILNLSIPATLNRFINHGLNTQGTRAESAYLGLYCPTQEHNYVVERAYDACAKCPLRQCVFPVPHPNQLEAGQHCPIAPYKSSKVPPPPFRRDDYVRDIAPDRALLEQYEHFVINDQPQCNYFGQAEALKFTHRKFRPTFSSFRVKLCFKSCPRCFLERHGVLRTDSHAAFDNFICDPPALQTHLDLCRKFTTDPRGILLLLGRTGTGKSHLAYAIARERFRRGHSGVVIVKQRLFLDRHWADKHADAFGEERPYKMLKTCKQASLLILDELGPATSNRDIEEPLLDLFESRIGNYLPTIVTGNIAKVNLEQVLGSRLYDRLRYATNAVLEFDFPSRRPSLNGGYLNDCRY